MSSRKNITRIFLFIFSVINVLFVHADNIDSTYKKDSHDYSFVLYAGGGLSVYRGTSGVTDVVNTDLTKTGLGGSLRVMWHPDHLLRFGFETGRIPFYSYKIDDGINSGKMTVSAVPLLIAWSMPVTKKFNFFLEYGLFIVNSRLEYLGVTNSKSNSLGYAVAINYIQPISHNLGLAGEVKWMTATETKDEIINAQVMIVWKFFSW